MNLNQRMYMGYNINSPLLIQKVCQYLRCEIPLQNVKKYVLKHLDEIDSCSFGYLQETSLLLAVSYINPELLLLLINYKANLFCVNEKKQNILHYLFASREFILLRISIYKIFIKRSTLQKCNLKKLFQQNDDSNKTPLYYAFQSGILLELPYNLQNKILYYSQHLEDTKLMSSIFEYLLKHWVHILCSRKNINEFEIFQKNSIKMLFIYFRKFQNTITLSTLNCFLQKIQVYQQCCILKEFIFNYKRIYI